MQINKRFTIHTLRGGGFISQDKKEKKKQARIDVDK